MAEKPDEATVNHRPGDHAIGELLGEPGTTDHTRPSEVIYADQTSVLTRH